jgi:hypothetical protein
MSSNFILSKPNQLPQQKFQYLGLFGKNKAGLVYRLSCHREYH